MNSKSILAHFLTAASALCLLAQPLLADQFGDFTYTDNGTSITITGYPDTAVGPVTIPSTIVGKPVTMIASNAFDSCSDLTSVTIPDSVTGIGNYAFSFCSSMTSASLGNNVASIGEGAFFHCYDLAAMTIPASVTSIGELVFDLCISLSATSVDPLNPIYCSVDGVLFNKNQTTLIKCPEGRVGSVSIPPGCTGLRHRALSYSTHLTTISVGASNPVYSSVNGVLFNKSQTTLLQYPAGKTGVYAIPSSVTTIGDWAFYGCRNLTAVSIPGSVTTLMAGALASCGNLTSITIPASVTSIGDWAFESGTNLASVTIPASVSFIGDRAFESCASLTGVYFKGTPPSLGGSEVFSGADSATVYYLSGATGWGSTYGGRPTALWDPLVPFNYTTTNGEVTITGYTGPGGAVTIPGTIGGLPVTGIGNDAFYSRTSLTGITIPNSVTEIGSYVFYNCEGLTTATLPAGLTRIEDGTFMHCERLANLTIPIGVTSIGYGAFYRCAKLPNPTIPNQVASIGDGAFGECVSLTQVTIPDSITKIGNGSGEMGGAFEGCTQLKSATFMGNAPLCGFDVFDSTASGFTVYYFDGAKGFTSPTWYGCRSIALAIPGPEISVQQPVGKNLKDGVSSKSFGSVALKSTLTKTFTIRNNGTANLTGIAISKSGAHAKNFTVMTPPLKSSLAPGASTTFKVTFKPSAKGNRKATIHIKSNDSNENPFDIALTGKGIAKKSAPSALAAAARLPSWPDSGGTAWLAHETHQTTGTVQLADGRKYLTLSVMKSPEDFLLKPTVEVSPNLIDWFSGRKHTTVITDDSSLLKVRDNTPFTPGNKRYIRINQIGQ